MAFPTKDRMPPPGSGSKGPGIAVMIAADKGGKPPGGAPGASPGSSGGKASREEALVVTNDHHCQACENYTPESGECSEVEGYFEPDDACLRYFEAQGGADDDDATEPGASSEPSSPPQGGGQSGGQQGY